MSVRVWQTIAGLAVAGWLSTLALGVIFWPQAAENPSSTVESDDGSLGSMRRDRKAVRRTTFDDDRRKARSGRDRMRPSPRVSDATDPDARDAAHGIPPRVMDAAKNQVRDEWRARREAQAERRLDRMLDQTATFAEEQGLDEDAQVALELAITDNHVRMQELFTELRGKTGLDRNDDSARLDRRNAMRDSFLQLEDDVAAVLDDDLTELFLTEIRGEGGRRER